MGNTFNVKPSSKEKSQKIAQKLDLSTVLTKKIFCYTSKQFYKHFITVCSKIFKTKIWTVAALLFCAEISYTIVFIHSTGALHNKVII